MNRIQQAKEGWCFMDPHIMDNFNEANIENIKKAWAEERAKADKNHSTYGMIPRNSKSEVTITKESRRSCVESLLR